MWVINHVASHIVIVRVIIVVDSHCMRVITLKVGLGSVCRDKVLSLLQSRHRVLMHTCLRAVLLSQLYLSMQAMTSPIWAATSPPIVTTFSSHGKCWVVSRLSSILYCRKVTDTITTNRQVSLSSLLCYPCCIIRFDQVVTLTRIRIRPTGSILPHCPEVALLAGRDQVVCIKGPPVKVGGLQRLLPLSAIRMVSLVNRIVCPCVATWSLVVAN